jgi:hypothetical protein
LNSFCVNQDYAAALAASSSLAGIGNYPLSGKKSKYGPHFRRKHFGGMIYNACEKRKPEHPGWLREMAGEGIIGEE